MHWFDQFLIKSDLVRRLAVSFNVCLITRTRSSNIKPLILYVSIIEIFDGVDVL